jgi:diaminohydroxyphosphoribosylaminopyrimidine deaminase/5-amino-6-(5-phosphoribosylamino)uracil reductase
VRLLITGAITNRLVHKWRSEEAAILVGTNTAISDNPALTNRLWTGKSPLRLVIDKQLRIPLTYQLFNEDASTVIFNADREEEVRHIRYMRVTEDEVYLQRLIHAMYQLQVQSVLIEGGARLLQSFIDEGFWDEARVISNGQLAIGKGLKAPKLENFIRREGQTLLSDTINVYSKQLTG